VSCEHHRAHGGCSRRRPFAFGHRFAIRVLSDRCECPFTSASRAALEGITPRRSHAAENVRPFVALPLGRHGRERSGQRIRPRILERDALTARGAELLDKGSSRVHRFTY